MVIYTGKKVLTLIIYADLDNDGKKDILYSYEDSGSIVAWIKNIDNENFNLSENKISTVPNSTPMALAVGDIDSDGDLDIFYQVWNQSIKVFLNNGNGIFTDSGKTFSGVFVSGQDPMIDLDGDGLKDLYLGNGNIVWYKNMGNGNFEIKGQIASDTGYAARHLLDFDKDGDIDILYYRTSFNEIGRFENTGNPTFTKHILGSVNRPYSILPLDLDADGNIDII